MSSLTRHGTYGLKPDKIKCLFELHFGSGKAVGAVESNSTWDRCGLKPNKITCLFELDFGSGKAVGAVESNSTWDRYGLKPDEITCLFELDVGSGTVVSAVESNSTWDKYGLKSDKITSVRARHRTWYGGRHCRIQLDMGRYVSKPDTIALSSDAFYNEQHRNSAQAVILVTATRESILAGTRVR